MKKISLFLTFLFSVLLLSAQDIIVKNSGETIKAYNLEASGTSVFFQLSAEPGAPLQKLPKTEILVVRKADGTKLDFDAPAPQPAAQQQQTATAQNKPVKLTLDMLSEEERTENERLIKQYNEPVLFKVTRQDYASFAVSSFSPKYNSIMSNKDISISLISGNETAASRNAPSEFHKVDICKGFRWWQDLGELVSLSITNKTDQTIYVDLGNSMLVAQGRSVPLYVPQTTTKSNTSVGGGSVNLGALTGSSLLGGFSVGGSNASSTVNTVYSQRVIAIGPYGTVQTPPVSAWGATTEERELVPGMAWKEIVCRIGNNRHLRLYMPKKSFRCGQVINFNEENAPLNISAYVSYSYTEDCAQEKTLSIHYYLKNLIGGDFNKANYKNFIEFIKFPGMPVHFSILDPKKGSSDTATFPLP